MFVPMSKTFKVIGYGIREKTVLLIRQTLSFLVVEIALHPIILESGINKLLLT